MTTPTSDMPINPHSPRSCGVTTVSPYRALVLSRIKHGGEHEYELSRKVTELAFDHEIFDTPDGWQLGSGRPLDTRALRDLAQHIDGNMIEDDGLELLPANVLAQRDDELVWHVPGTVAPMFFLDVGAARVADQVETVWPSLVFHARGGRLDLYATQDRARPGADTPLYRAPLMNHSHSHGGLCFGNVPRPGRAQVASLTQFESAVFDTNFTHIMGEWPLHASLEPEEVAQDQAVLSFYQGLRDDQATEFPNAALKPVGLTLGELFADCSNRP